MFLSRVEYLVRNTSLKLCGETKKNSSADFIFCDNISSGHSFLLVNTCVSVGLAGLVVGAGVNPAVMAACVPIIVPMTNSLLDAGVPIGEDAKRSMSHMMSVNSAQLSFGLVEFLMGDIVNGFVHMLMAGVGFYVTRIDGIVMLPTFSMASTVFASVSVVNLFDMLLTKGLPSGDLAMTANFVRLATICHPFLYAVSAYYAWRLIEQLRTGLLVTPATLGPLGAVTLLEPETRAPFEGRGFRLNQPVEEDDNTMHT